MNRDHQLFDTVRSIDPVDIHDLQVLITTHFKSS